MRRAVGSSLEVATASRTPAARRSASSASIPSNSAFIAQPRAPYSARKAAIASSASLAELHRAEGVVHRRADDLSGQVAVGHRGADVGERVQEAGDDPLRGVGQRAVEIEDHQLRPTPGCVTGGLAIG